MISDDQDLSDTLENVPAPVEPERFPSTQPPPPDSQTDSGRFAIPPPPPELQDAWLTQAIFSLGEHGRALGRYTRELRSEYAAIMSRLDDMAQSASVWQMELSRVTEERNRVDAANNLLIRKQLDMLEVRADLDAERTRSVIADVAKFKDELADIRTTNHRLVELLTVMSLREQTSTSHERTVPVPDAPRVLVLDDEAQTRDTIRKALSDTFNVRTVRTIREAEAALTEETVDVLLADLHPGPGEDAMGFVRWMRDHHHRIGVVIVTGMASEAIRDEARALGVLVLEKPFDLPVLVRTIRAVC